VIPFVAPIFYFTEQAFCTFENKNQTDFAQYWFKEVPVPKLLVSMEIYQPLMIRNVYLLVLQISAYLLSMCLARMTLSELKRQSSNMSPKTKALQNQLARHVKCVHLY
jgi:hypothetical protein